MGTGSIRLRRPAVAPSGGPRASVGRRSPAADTAAVSLATRAVQRAGKCEGTRAAAELEVVKQLEVGVSEVAVPDGGRAAV